MADPSHLGLPTPSKSQRSKDEAIINRGREHKGLTGSFSSNLGQRTSSAQTCREPKSKAGANGFVKALVAKLESSDDISTMSSMSNLSAGSTSPKSKQPVSPVSSPSPDSSYQKPPNVLQAAPGVEGYSLTFLKYQQYFARDKPLYRCLDEQEASSDSSKTRVVFQSSGGETPLPEELQKILRGSPEKPSQEAQPQLKRAEATTPKKADHNGTGEIQTNTADKQPQDGNTNKRDPEEVKAFWDHVRNYLAPSDSESDEPEAPSKKRGGKKDRRNNREAASSLSPHRKANSAPNVDVRGYFTPPGRVRFLSVEEKMIEIDEFFGTEDNNDETSVRR